MKAEGSAQNADAQYVRENCIQTQNGGLVELITPKVPTAEPILCVLHTHNSSGIFSHLLLVHPKNFNRFTSIK